MTVKKNKTDQDLTALGPVDETNLAAAFPPYMVRVTIQGVATILLHRYQVESVAAKAAAAKGSATKKTDDVESYVYRCPDGTIGLPSSYIQGAIAGPQGAAKFRQDPRSPRKCAIDLYRAGVVPVTETASFGTSDWDALDQRRVVVQRAAISRVRPCFLPGWQLTYDLMVVLPEYIKPLDLLAVLQDAGRLVGIGDFRPTYGRFVVTRFEELTNDQAANAVTEVILRTQDPA